ncbi:MAG: L-aspartate oxidase [Planctomycetota bacterium]
MNSLFDERRYLIPFRSTLLPQIFTDTLVIGAGVAGMRVAVAAADGGDVIVLSKSELSQTNTAWAQGGIAAVMDEADSVDGHVADTLEAGAGLCDVEVVRDIVTDGSDRLAEMIRWGLMLDRDADGQLIAGQEGAHGVRRIYHARGDQTGAEVQRCLTECVRNNDRIRLFGGCFLLDLITPADEPGAPVLGAVTHHPKFGLQMIWARTTILASGGAGVLYRETTNPSAATADGFAAAYRAGATITDAAFVQFHPTALYLPGAARELISEAVRGEGAKLLDANGRRFMHDYDQRGELAPRDIVSRAIVSQIATQGGQHVWLDCRDIHDFSSRFPGISKALSRFAIDPQTELVPVHPAAHYTIGGVRADAAGRTGVPGLLAVGEAACTGLHGANRLASNSLLEGLVCGAAAGELAAEGRDAQVGQGEPRPIKVVSDLRQADSGELDLSDVWSSLRSAMWRNVGIVRAGSRLADASEMLDFWARYTLDKIFDGPEGWETQNLLLVGALVTRSADWRKESRGCHARTDFTETLESFEVHDGWRRGESEPSITPVTSGSEAEANV